jgi:EF-hand domain-containing family member B
MSHTLGQTRNLGQDSGLRPRDTIYGKPSGTKSVSAADVMRGKYSVAEQQPDRDLGKSILPGFRNLTVEVIYI